MGVSPWAAPFVDPDDEQEYEEPKNVTPGKRRLSVHEQIDAMRDGFETNRRRGARVMKWGFLAATIGFIGLWFWTPFFLIWFLGMGATFIGWYDWRLAKIQLGIDPRQFF